MLKIIRSPNVLKLKIKNDNDEVIRFGIDRDSDMLAKKSGKLKSQNLAKSRKLSKSEKSKSEKSKKWLKSRNLSNFSAKKAGPNFLTPDVKTTFNRLWLAFTKALIFDILIQNATLDQN